MRAAWREATAVACGHDKLAIFQLETELPLEYVEEVPTLAHRRVPEAGLETEQGEVWVGGELLLFQRVAPL
jgi:hypothetical protein